MAIEVAGKRFVTLADEFFVNGAKVYAAFANGVKVYPDGDMPDYIAVTRLPNKTEYFTWETIDYTGIEVTAYFDNGMTWGVVPFDELVFPRTVYPSETSADKWSPILEGILKKPVFVDYGEAGYEQKFVDKVIGIGTTNYYVYNFYFGDFVVTSLHVPSPYFLIANNEQVTITRHWISAQIDPWKVQSDYTEEFTIQNNYTYEGKTVYFSSFNSPYFGDALNRLVPDGCVTPVSDVDVLDYDSRKKIAWAMVYGNIAFPVKWTRPDGVELETFFTM